MLAFNAAQGLDGYSQEYDQPVKVLMGLVLLILLIAITNVAMMINARNAARLREFSLRLALGAKRSRLFVQLLTESALLVIAGAGVVMGVDINGRAKPLFMRVDLAGKTIGYSPVELYVGP